MTNLELLICEAENNGEISIDTRNDLLSVLTESESQLFKHAQIFKKYNEKFPEFKSLTSELHSCEKELAKVDITNRSSISVLLRLLIHLVKLLSSLESISSGISIAAGVAVTPVNPSLGIKAIIIQLIKLTIDKFIICLSNVALVASDLTYAKNASKELDKLINKEKDADKRDSYQNMKERLENAISAAEDALASDSLIQTGTKAKDAAKTAIDKVFKKESVDFLKGLIYEKELSGDITENERKILLSELTK